MGKRTEAWRGRGAVMAFIFAMPLICFRMGYFAREKLMASNILRAGLARLFTRSRIRVEVSGPPPATKTGCVVCYNETSLIDVAALISAVMPHVDQVTAAEVFARIPFARKACEKADIALVPRGDRQATDRLMDKIVADLRQGDRISWGGEGRLSGKDEVARFKVGAALLAIRAGVPIVPVAIFGGHQIMPLGSARTRPGTMFIRFGVPIDSLGYTEDGARDLADYTQMIVAELYADLKAARSQHRQ